MESNDRKKSTSLVKTKEGKYDLMAYGHDEQFIDLVRDQICPGASDAELALFLLMSSRAELNPMFKQIYCIPRWDNRLGRKVYQTQIGIDGARLTAEKSGEYEGQCGPFWAGIDGVWKDHWTAKEPPAVAKVGVYRKGFREPTWGVADWAGYAQKNKDGGLTGMWATIPATMLAKCAEMQALRKVFPVNLSGMYEKDEPYIDVDDLGEKADADPALLEAALKDAIAAPKAPAKAQAKPKAAPAQEPINVTQPAPAPEPKAAPKPAPEPKPEPTPAQEPNAPTPCLQKTQEGLTAFFATAERLGCPNIEENVQYLRWLWPQVVGKPMNEIADIMLEVIAGNPPPVRG